MIKECLTCKKQFEFEKTRKETFCSRECFYQNHSGQTHSRWKGGKPKCLDCKKQLKNFYAKRCQSCAGRTKIFTNNHKLNLSKALIGRKRPNLTGSNNGSWKGGRTSVNKALRESFEYEEWRKKVFERDLYTCQHCKQVGGYLQADHIKRFSNYPELRLDINNGQTLCIKCHQTKTALENKIYWNNQYKRLLF